jgi:hypothetical protein
MLIVNLLLLFLVSHFSRGKYGTFSLDFFCSRHTKQRLCNFPCHTKRLTIADILLRRIVCEIYLISTIQQINRVKIQIAFAAAFVAKNNISLDE